MLKITPTQSRLLICAAERDNGSLFPLPETMTHPPTVRRSIAALIGRGWAKSRPTTEESAMAHMEGNTRFGVFITPAGHVAIGIIPDGDSVNVAATTAPRTTKAAKIIALLLREQGATLAELTDVTGWLPHTTRAALTGLRKKGHVLAKSKHVTGLACYRIVVA